MANRIDGIMSGWDTESMIKGMLSHQQNQIDRLKKQSQIYTWQRERYTDIYSKISTFRDSMYNYKLDSTTKLKSALSSNEAVATAKASSDAAVGTHNLTVYKLAQGAQTGSQSSMKSSSNKESINKQFTDIDSVPGSGSYTGEFDIMINGKKITVDTTRSMNDFTKQINNANAGVTASYDANTDRFFISSNATGAEAKIDFTPVEANGTPITDPTELAKYDMGKTFLTKALKLPAATAQDVTDAGNETPPRTIALGDVLLIKGQDAEFDLDGITGLKQSSNEFTISGITYNLKSADAAGVKTTVTVNNDTTAIYDSVVNFVNMYNELLDSVNGIVYEQKNKSFTPLTDDQKSAMTAEQIKEWETKAQAGILRNDPILMGIRNDMRTIVYSSVSGIPSQMVGGKKVTYNSLFAIGLKTGDYSTNGKLEIDEAKLKAAIEADPDAVNKILNGGTDAKGNRTDGVADKLYDQLKLGMDKINDYSGAASGGKELTSTLAKKLASNEKSINAKVTRYNNQMATYYKQFDAMEKLLQQLQSQQESLYNYLGS